MLRTVAVLFLLSAAVFAQTTEQQQFTTQAPINARYEIKQIRINWTLRLDRYTGMIDRLTRTSNGSAWEEMPVADLQPTDSSGPRFQLSALAGVPDLLFLLDTLTGQTWKLSYAVGKNGVNELNVWRPIAK